MKTQFLILPLILSAVMLTGGCATKKFVRNTTAPIQAKVDQVGEQTNKNAADIDVARKETKSVDERAENGISAAKERAMTAESRANEAMTKATEVGTLAADAKSKGDKNADEIGVLRNVIANIDDYKVASETTVTFGFNKAELTQDAKEQLDKVVENNKNMKRYVIAVEGFTDKIGTSEYNTALSQRRANSVVNYLVSKHQIPVYRIYTVGLGKEKPLDEGRTRMARAKNRRVEVRIYNADQTSTLSASNPTR